MMVKPLIVSAVLLGGFGFAMGPSMAATSPHQAPASRSQNVAPAATSSDAVVVAQTMKRHRNVKSEENENENDAPGDDGPGGDG